MKVAKIALLTIDYPPQHGGVARYLSHLVRASGGEIDVFLPRTHAVVEGVERIERLDFSPLSRWYEFVTICRTLAQRGYKTLFLSHVFPIGTAAAVASFLGGPEYILLIHGLDLRLAQTSSLKRSVLRFVLRRAKQVLTNSQAVAQEVRAFDPKLQPVVMTPGCESMTLPSHQAARVQLGISPGTTIYLTVARFIPRKGIDTFLSVLRHLPESAQYVIVGAGPDELRLQKLVRQFGLEKRVQFIVSPTDQVRNEWYAAADIFVFLARDEGKDLEGFGIVCLEAALAGLPVMVSRSGGVPETVVDGQTGVVVDASDQANILALCQRWSADPALRAQLGEAGRKRVERDFRWVDRWTQLARLLGYSA